MHAARALNAQRKRREEKLQIQTQRNSSAASRRSASRSPVPSEIDVEAGVGFQPKRKKPVRKSNSITTALYKVYYTHMERVHFNV